MALRKRSSVFTIVQVSFTFASIEIGVLNAIRSAELDPSLLQQIASFCPNLQSIQLNMCGQFNDACLNYYSEKLKDLKTLELYGCHLVTKDCWRNFLKTYAPTGLEGLSVRHSARKFVKDQIMSKLNSNLVFFQASTTHVSQNSFITVLRSPLSVCQN
jgi:hypothetical protein